MQTRKKVKYFGKIVASERFCYTFAEKIEEDLIFTILILRNYVLDIGISI